MRRKLNVYAWRWQDGHGRYREITAAKNIAEVRRILGCGPIQAVELAIRETDSIVEREIALNSPGTVFRADGAGPFHRR